MSQADELLKLQRLYDRGALTDSEFARAKANVLDNRDDFDDARDFDDYREPGTEKDVNQWAMILHLSQFAGYAAPLAGWIVPIIMWQMKKDEWPEIDAHGKNVANWLISQILYILISIPLVFVIIGIPMLIAIGVMGVAFPIIGGLKANRGEEWRYPCTIKFFD